MAPSMAAPKRGSVFCSPFLPYISSLFRTSDNSAQVLATASLALLRPAGQSPAQPPSAIPARCLRFVSGLAADDPPPMPNIRQPPSPFWPASAPASLPCSVSWLPPTPGDSPIFSHARAPKLTCTHCSTLPGDYP